MVLNETKNEVNEKIITIPPHEIPDITGLGKIYYDNMVKYKDLIAQTDAKTGETETYDILLKRSIQTAIAMRSRGIGPKDIISVCSYNSMDSSVPYYAGLFIGAISANLDPGIPAGDMTHLIKIIKPKMLFVIPESLEIIEEAVKKLELDTQIIVFGDTTKYTKYSEFLVPTPEENNFEVYEVKDPKETAVIVFTSGSTGLPKGACLSHYGLMGHIYQVKTHTVPRNAAVLAISNLYWISAVSLSLYFFRYGANRIIAPAFDRDEVWKLIHKYKIVALFLNSYHALELVKDGKPAGIDGSSVRSVLLSGYRLTKEQMRKFKECLTEAVAYNGYGQTETSGSSLSFNTNTEEDLRLLKKNPHSVGRPLPGYSYKIVDPDTQEILGPNQQGEIRVKSEYCMNGYYKVDSSHEWDSDGYLKTGDIGYYDEDKCFYIVDRIKDVLKYRTYYVYPAQMEKIFLDHPAVYNVVVIGKPHERDGDIPTAVVVLKASHEGKVTVDELQKFVDDQVAEFQRIRGGVKIVKELPLTITNKVSRQKVKQYVIEGKF